MDGRQEQRPEQQEKQHIAALVGRSDPTTKSWETVSRLHAEPNKNSSLSADMPMPADVFDGHASVGSGKAGKAEGAILMREARPSESLNAILHDARTMVSAMELYCDLLEVPGVLAAPFRHYAEELRMVGYSSRRVLEKLEVIGRNQGNRESSMGGAPNLVGIPTPDSYGSDYSVRGLAVSSYGAANNVSGTNRDDAVRVGVIPGLARPIQSLARELQANQNLLIALAGAGIHLDLLVSGGDCSIAMTGEDLTRVLVNLTRNAVDAMPSGGRIQVVLDESADRINLTFSDTGAGIPEGSLEEIFVAGYTTRDGFEGKPGSNAKFELQRARHRGLGLAIVRSLVSGAGGTVRCRNGPNAESHPVSMADASGAIFRLEFPINAPVKITPSITANAVFSKDSATGLALD